MSGAKIKRDAKRFRILDAAIEMALEDGYLMITKRGIARRADVNESLVAYYWGDVESLKGKVLETAVERGILKIVAQGLCAGDDIAVKAPLEQRKLAAEMIIDGL